MPIREARQAKEELAIFNAFRAAHPSFSNRVADVKQPEDEFPDVIVHLHDGQRIDFELAEWLQPQQMAASMRRERLRESILDAIGEQGENSSEYFNFILLFPRPDSPTFKRSDADDFRKEIWELVQETDRRWMTERHWRTPQGRQVYDFNSHPILGKYVVKIIFDPILASDDLRKYPSGIPWIDISMPCFSYSSDSAIEALESILQAKLASYGGLHPQPRLLVYYGSAVAYNTPWYDIKFRKFVDVAEKAAQLVADQSSFERIYLLKALEPGLEAYEVSPNFARCD